MNKKPEAHQLISTPDASSNESELNEQELDQVSGGLLPAVKNTQPQELGVLLPAVQKVREAASR